MSDRTTALGAPSRFDAFALASDGDEIAGTVDARRLPRVADQLASGSAPVPLAWRIRGGKDAMARPMLTLSIEGEVPLVCQRCLEPFAAPIAQQTPLLLAHDESELAQLDAEESEVVLANNTVDPLRLVEDELLLSLPLSPRHREGGCGAASRATPAGVKDSPFARLAGLKTRNPG